MHDRIYGALYPLAFGVMAFALLGFPRTTRQSRAVSMFAVIGAVAGLRLAGFAGTAMGVNFPIALGVVYVLIAVAIALGGYVVWRGVAVDLDEKIDFAQMARTTAAFVERTAARFNINLPAVEWLRRRGEA